MSLSEKQIVKRKEILLKDLEQQQNNVQVLEKQKIEAIALVNALTGAIQQCDQFLNELNNASSDVENNES
jgi:hypothetical protein|tara:strand:- start:228 stop:437 length:210 start_codon:yes stop_codon:yes gene_type:complete